MGNKISQSDTGNDNEKYDYDFLVIGGGSGGLSAAKEAAALGQRVILFDYVTPSPFGNQWGFGGTCVSVGCIPKKLLHQAGLLGEYLKEKDDWGWISSGPSTFDWNTVIQNMNSYIDSVCDDYLTSLEKAGIKYVNAFATFLDNHTVEAVYENGVREKFSASIILIAVGGRPRYMDIPGGSKEDAICITSDDLFTLKENPGKTLVIGASYIALETCGFLAGMGIEVTMLVRSVILRGFDEQVIDRMKSMMTSRGISLLYYANPERIEKDNESNSINVSYSIKGVVHTESFDTVMLAVGRVPYTQLLNCNKAGVEIDPDNGRVVVDKYERTAASNIYCIGDAAKGRPELTPPAIQAGILLSQRLFGNSKVIMDYSLIPTTVFTPIEYGCIGIGEEEAVEVFGQKKVVAYESIQKPLEWALSTCRKNEFAYSKLVCIKQLRKEKVIGFHYFGPNAGEITQGFALAMKLGATKNDFDMLVGLHPTCAEIFTDMRQMKVQGSKPKPKRC